MRFLVDDQLPPALVALLRSAGHQAWHVADVELTGAKDQDIWQYASGEKLIIVTKDQDFVVMRSFGVDGPAVVWVRWGNTRKSALLASFARSLNQIIAALERGEKLIELV